MVTGNDYMAALAEAERARIAAEAEKAKQAAEAAAQAQAQAEAAAQAQAQAAQAQAQTEGQDILSVSRTSDPNKFVVRIQVEGETPGVARNEIMTREQVLDAGGEIPAGGYWATGILAERLGGHEYPTERGVAEAAAQREAELRDIAEQIGWDGTIESLLEKITKEPNSPLWNLEAAGGGLTIEEKMRLFSEAGVYYDPQKDFRESHVPVGIDTRGETQYITKLEAEKIKKSSPNLWDVLHRKGIDAYEATVKQYTREQQVKVDALAALNKAGVISQGVDGGKVDITRAVALGLSDELRDVGVSIVDIRQAGKDIEEIKKDDYLYSVFLEKGVEGYKEALEKRVSDIAAIQERASAREKAKYTAAVASLAGFGFNVPIGEATPGGAWNIGGSREFTIQNMAQYARTNKDGIKNLATYGFSDEVLESVKNYNTELGKTIGEINGLFDTMPRSATDTLSSYEMALETALRDLEITKIPGAHWYGQVRIDDETGEAISRKEAVKRVWDSLSDSQREQVALEWRSDYFKGSTFAEVTHFFQKHAEKEGEAGTLLFGLPLAITTPVAKQLTLDAAKQELSQRYASELKNLSGYLQSNGSFDVSRLRRDMERDSGLESRMLEQSGYKNREDLLNSLEFYNYGTRVTPKEWAISGLSTALVVLGMSGGGGLGAGLLGKAVSMGIPASLGALILPDTIKAIKDEKTPLAEKILAGAMTAALLAPVGVGVGRFAFKELRQFVKPGTFEPSGVSLEVSIPRTQLRGNMTPANAQKLVQDLERVYSGKVPKGTEEIIAKFKTPEEAQAWLSEIVRKDIMTNQVRAIKAYEGTIKARSNPLQAALNQNTLFSIKPDINTYLARIGRQGKDITPNNAMEWWSPNYSGDVAGWYLGKIPDAVLRRVDRRAGIGNLATTEKAIRDYLAGERTFDYLKSGLRKTFEVTPEEAAEIEAWYTPGAKILRYSAEDLKDIPDSVYKSVAEKMQNEKAWARAKAEAKGDSISAVNDLVRDEIYRRMNLPRNHPDALPQGIYPVFKFHWSREPSGRLSPTWELEFVTPSGFSSEIFRPVRYLDRAKTGGETMPEVAAMTVKSPIRGIDKITGQKVKLGQSMPVIITATKAALKEGKGLPKITELYAAKYKYRPIAAIQNIFDRGRMIRPEAVESSMVTTPRAWYSRALKFEKPRESTADVAAKRYIQKLREEGKAEILSTDALAAELEKVDAPKGAKITEGGRLTRTREAYYHPVREYADNWVVPRVGVMLEHPKIKGAYIVVTDTSSAAQPGVWDIVGGQIDIRGQPRVNRPFGRISVQEAAREQVISELGVDLKNIRPAEIHAGKMTEHSAYGGYMFDAKPTSLKFDIPMNKWYDMVRGEWVIEPEVGAIKVLRSGEKAKVTPSLYIELYKRGFDVENLSVVDKGLPTAGAKQYARGTPEYNILKNAKKATLPKNKRAVAEMVEDDLSGKDILYRAAKEPERVKVFYDTFADAGPTDYIVPTTASNRAFTGLVPSLRPMPGEAADMAVYTVSSPEEAAAVFDVGERLPAGAEREVPRAGEREFPVVEEGVTPRAEARRAARAETRATPRAETRETPRTETRPRVETRTTPRTEPRPTPRTEPRPTISEVTPEPTEPVEIPRPVPGEKKEKRRRKLGDLSDTEKRRLIASSHSAVTYKRGELEIEGELQGVWHTFMKEKRDSDWERVITIGLKPDGAVYSSGPESATRTMRRLAGEEPINILEDTGAVDTVIKGEAGEEHPTVKFVRDKKVKAGKARSERGPGEIDLGAGVVQEGKRRHIRW